MRFPNGFPGWVDLTTPDATGATDFYTSLFGWVANDVPTDGGPPYTMLYLGEVGDGNLVCGLGPQMPEQREAGVPSTWVTYVMVGDVDEMVTAAPGAGGSVVMPAMDVMTQGRMALVADPSGAVIGLWQPRDHQGADAFNTPGTWVWSELQSRDVGAALPFYEEMFGWRWEKMPPDSGSDYVVAHLDAKGEAAEGVDTSVAGAMAMPPGVPDEAPSGWNVYFGVTDCDEAAARIAELGGSVVAGPMDAGGMRFAVVTDPFGAYFHIMTVE